MVADFSSLGISCCSIDAAAVFFRYLEYGVCSCNANAMPAFSFCPLYFRLRSHCFATELIRFCRYLSAVHTTLLLCRNPNKNIRFCAFTLVTAMEEKMSVSVVLIL